MGDVFGTFENWYATYGYPVLFLGVLLENAGVPVPGETAVLIAAFLASPAGGSRFHLVWVILVTVAAAVIGDNIGYWLGRRIVRSRLERGRSFLFLTPERIHRAEGYFTRHGAVTIFVARFITGLRVVAAPAAGCAGMHWPRFFFANAAGAACWASAVGLLGYFFGRSWKVLHHWLGWGAWILLGIFAIVLVIRHFWQRKHGTDAGSP
jgi:membrane protein DedA with SNARE-associated domain